MPNWGRIGAGIASGGLTEVGRYVAPKLDRTDNEFLEVDPTGQLAGAAGRSAQFGEQGLAGYGARTAALGGVTDHLRGQMMGENSLAAEQLRQQQQNLVGSQASMAAGARGGGQGMAAFQAMQNAGNIGVGMAGQGATAGIQERNLAAQNLGGVLGQMRGQDIQAGLGGFGQQLQGLSEIERQRMARFGTIAGQPTGWEKAISLGIGAGKTLGTAGGGGAAG